MSKSKVLSFNGLMEPLDEVVSNWPDSRTGNNCRYTMRDAGLGAFSVFFMQCASFLGFQKLMCDSLRKSNAQTLFGMEAIPCDNWIRTLLDPMPPSSLFGIFDTVVTQLNRRGQLKPRRVLNGQLLVALDGVEYFHSDSIHCGQCSTRSDQHGQIRYSHQVITPVIVSPGEHTVIALAPEFIRPQDGHTKQDCETTAAKRWLQHQGTHYKRLGITILGDDLYCHQPMCEAILAQGMHFILVCKPGSHQTLYEWLEGLEPKTLEVRRWTGRAHQFDHYRYLNDLPLRDGDDALSVNGCELVTTNEQGRVVYRNSFATDHRLSARNVKAIVKAGRTRWKIENENNNTLKTQGYHFEHNYGHGEQFLSAVLATLILLAFLFHTVLSLLDRQYQQLRDYLGARKVFFDDLRALTRYICFPHWQGMLDFMRQRLELEPP